MNNSLLPVLFQVFKCTRASCGLRFSVELGDPKGSRCPLCRAPCEPVDRPYGQAEAALAGGPPPGPELEALLDNIRSAWNVGSMLRAADGAGVRRVHLCGVSATPANPKVAKTALGAEKTMPYTTAPDAAAHALALKEAGLRLWALEGGRRAESLFDLTGELKGSPMVLVAGNEVSGVDPGVLALCERVVMLPMQGMKGSLNVAVAFGIAVYTIRYGARD